MFYVSEIQKEPPHQFQTELQGQVYRTLTELRIPYERVDSDEAVTMADCTAIDERLDMAMVKTLFLCNRQKTEFYLFITAGNKAFRSSSFSKALVVSRVSFAPAELMQEMLGTKIGAATVFSCLLDSARGVRVVFDKDVLREEYYGCSDGTTTGYMKLKTSDVLEKFLPFCGHVPTIVEI